MQKMQNVAGGGKRWYISIDGMLNYVHIEKGGLDMGRAGAGGGSSGGSFGGHSSGHSSGGHRSGGGRAGAGSSFEHSFGGGPHGGRRYDHGPGPGPEPRWHPNYYGGGIVYYPTSLIEKIIGYALVGIFILVIALSVFGNVLFAPKSTINREKIESPVAFTNNCVVDELGWVDNISQTETELKNFYNKTGVQPYVVFCKYNTSLTTDEQKEEYANEYYDKNINNEGTFLFMYFAEANEDDVGYMCYVNGKKVSSVMDAEAVNIFWNYMDSNWYSDKSTDDVIIDTFDSTAKTIMHKSATLADVGVKVAGVALVVVIIGGVVIIMKVRRKHEHERAEETERILKTDIHGDVGNSPADDLADKYSH